MKKLALCSFAFVLCGCSQSYIANYTPSANGCVYSESYKVRHYLWDYFGVRDSEMSVTYPGVTCKTIIESELKEQTHKKPYNTIEVVSELPQKIEIQ